MQIVLSFVAVIVSLILVVGLHEAGHAFAAHWLGVKIKRVSFGFGRPFLRWRREDGFEWVIGVWPVGGYVQLLNTRIEPVPLKQQRYCFDKQAVWKRILILMAGGLANLILTLAALIIFYMAGYTQTQPVISQVIAQSSAAQAGMQPGDRILRLENTETNSWQAVGVGLLANWGRQNMTLEVQNSAGVKQTLSIDLSSAGGETRKNSLFEAVGFVPDASSAHQEHVEGVSFSTAVQQALVQIGMVVWILFIIVKKLILGVIPFSLLLGPIGFVSEVMASFIQGAVVYLFFIANLSLAVGFINLLPIPGLDGSLIVYALMEKIRGKPISIPMEILLHRLALIAFCVLLVNLLLNDAVRLIG